MNNATTILIIMSLAVFASIFISIYHTIYTGDTIASYFGYFFSMVILPASTGGAVGFSGMLVLRTKLGTNFKETWWLPTACAAASLTPAAIYYIGASLPHH